MDEKTKTQPVPKTVCEECALQERLQALEETIAETKKLLKVLTNEAKQLRTILEKEN